MGLALKDQGLGRNALQVWEEVLKEAHNASVNERPMLNKICSESPNFVPNSRRRTEGSVWNSPHSLVLFLTRTLYTKN